MTRVAPGERARGIERMLREAAPSALAVLARRIGDFDAAEDAVQEALIAAAEQWPRDGVPSSPRAWLVSVGHRRWVDAVRRDAARRAREDRDAALDPVDPDRAGVAASRDDSLALFVLCCHPSLGRPAQLALTLRAVGGLTTAEIARGLLVPEATVAQRISRAKYRLRAGGARFRVPDAAELPDRMAAVRQVLHLMYTEGHTASAGASLARADLSAEAVRLTRMLREATAADAPWRAETDGLLALMLLTDARRPARLRPAGPGGPPELVPLDEQDRSLWRRDLIAEGTALVEHALASGGPGPYQLQAAIAALHDEAPSTDDTDWPQVLALYELLRRIGPGPMVELGWVVALAMVDGPDAALRELETVALEPALAEHFRVRAVRAHLLERAGRDDEARAGFAEAARLALNATERRYLEGKPGG
ncbi:sigma factor-like helix-turn-helix DNA-binding protein [Agromyces tropicus]|uniref:Sigma factor-like helix-turn-helix DNA-binding protein n=1 Tax=Agromyces tropicus TaxID=555371 RepID=A0ABN2UEZ8_9MICO